MSARERGCTHALRLSRGRPAARAAEATEADGGRWIGRRRTGGGSGGGDGRAGGRNLSVRDFINRNPAATAGVLIVAIAGIIAATVWQVRDLTPSKPGAYYTIDDGKSWFKDDPQKI